MQAVHRTEPPGCSVTLRTVAEDVVSEPVALRAIALVALLEHLVELTHALALVALELHERLRRHGLVAARVTVANLIDRQA